jgi:hypothetical protein
MLDVVELTIVCAGCCEVDYCLCWMSWNWLLFVLNVVRLTAVCAGC